MSILSRTLLGMMVFVMILSTAGLLVAQTQPDSTLFTTYTINSPHTSLTWIVCGSTLQTSGCFAAGSLGPFGKIGAVLEGNQFANLKTSTVARYIYVVDVASGTSLAGVTLYVYKKTDVVSSTFDTVTVTLVKTLSLPLTGGTTALTSMAANNNCLFVGTDQGPNALRIQKSNYAITDFGGFSPPINVSAITSDKYGYVTITYGDFAGPNNGFIVVGPDGNTREDGGGAPFMLTTDQAILPSTLP